MLGSDSVCSGGREGLGSSGWYCALPVAARSEALSDAKTGVWAQGLSAMSLHRKVPQSTLHLVFWHPSMNVAPIHYFVRAFEMSLFDSIIPFAFISWKSSIKNTLSAVWLSKYSLTEKTRQVLSCHLSIFRIMNWCFSEGV